MGVDVADGANSAAIEAFEISRLSWFGALSVDIVLRTVE